MDNINDTMRVTIEKDHESEVRDAIATIYDALQVKGYDPISQIVGYILSDDPSYITGYNGARSLVSKFERDELLEEFVKYYVNNL